MIYDTYLRRKNISYIYKYDKYIYIYIIDMYICYELQLQYINLVPVGSTCPIAALWKKLDNKTPLLPTVLGGCLLLLLQRRVLGKVVETYQ